MTNRIADMQVDRRRIILELKKVIVGKVSIHICYHWELFLHDLFKQKVHHDTLFL